MILQNITKSLVMACVQQYSMNIEKANTETYYETNVYNAKQV